MTGAYLKSALPCRLVKSAARLHIALLVPPLQLRANDCILQRKFPAMEQLAKYALALPRTFHLRTESSSIHAMNFCATFPASRLAAAAVLHSVQAIRRPDN